MIPYSREMTEKRKINAARTSVNAKAAYASLIMHQ